MREARLQTHYAVQWLARAARGHIAAKPDDSHTNLGWDEGLDGLVTHALPGGERLVLSIPALTLAVVDAESTPHTTLALANHNDNDARVWLGEQVQAMGFDAAALDAPSPWEMPAHPIAKGDAYAGVGLAEARQELAAWFAHADRALARINRAYTDRQFAVTPVRCWPHHFDIATLISLEGGDPEHAKSVNAGLSPGDGSYEEPYFYVSPWPYPDAAKLPPLPSIGHWHTAGFVAAVAPATPICTAADRPRAIDTFLESAVAAAIAALT